MGSVIAPLILIIERRTMEITLYQNYSPENFLNKQLTELKKLNVVFKEEFDIKKPVLKLKDKTNFNYIGIPKLNRYYYVDQVEYLDNQLKEVTCRVDVLQSNKDLILSSVGDLEKSTSLGDNYIVDDYPYISKRKQFIKNFTLSPDAVNSQNIANANLKNYVLQVVGGRGENFTTEGVDTNGNN